MDIDIASPLGVYIIDHSRLKLDQLNPSVRSVINWLIDYQYLTNCLIYNWLNDCRGYMSAMDYINSMESKCPGRNFCDNREHINVFDSHITDYFAI